MKIAQIYLKFSDRLVQIYPTTIHIFVNIFHGRFNGAKISKIGPRSSENEHQTYFEVFLYKKLHAIPT